MRLFAREHTARCGWYCRSPVREPQPPELEESDTGKRRIKSPPSEGGAATVGEIHVQSPPQVLAACVGGQLRVPAEKPQPKAEEQSWTEREAARCPWQGGRAGAWAQPGR